MLLEEAMRMIHIKLRSFSLAKCWQNYGLEIHVLENINVDLSCTFPADYVLRIGNILVFI